MAKLERGEEGEGYDSVGAGGQLTIALCERSALNYY